MCFSLLMLLVLRKAGAIKFAAFDWKVAKKVCIVVL
jgi:hypothetical protein